VVDVGDDGDVAKVHGSPKWQKRALAARDSGE